MILDSRVIDFAYLYGSSGWVMKLPAMVMTPATIASQIESHMSAVDTYYKSIIEFYTAE